MSHHPSLRKVPKVSVGMPTYNAERWVVEAVESILKQTFSDFELIISDNASSDRTYTLCEELASRDSRIRLLRNKRNLGANRNYQLVLDNARGSYFKWASSNDVCAPEFIDLCVRALEQLPSAVLACPRSYLFENSLAAAEPYHRDVALLEDAPAARFFSLHRKMGLNNIFNGVIRRSALARVSTLGNYNGADIVLMGELALLGKFILLDERLLFRRMSPESATKLKTPREAELHIVPTAKGPLQWQSWRYHLAVLKCARHTHFPSRDWLQMVNYGLRALLWSRRELAREVVRGLSP